MLATTTATSASPSTGETSERSATKPDASNESPSFAPSSSPLPKQPATSGAMQGLGGDRALLSAGFSPEGSPIPTRPHAHVKSSQEEAQALPGTLLPQQHPEQQMLQQEQQPHQPALTKETLQQHRQLLNTCIAVLNDLCPVPKHQASKKFVAANASITTPSFQSSPGGSGQATSGTSGSNPTTATTTATTTTTAITTAGVSTGHVPARAVTTSTTATSGSGTSPTGAKLRSSSSLLASADRAPNRPSSATSIGGVMPRRVASAMSMRTNSSATLTAGPEAAPLIDARGAVVIKPSLTVVGADLIDQPQKLRTYLVEKHNIRNEEDLTFVEEVFTGYNQYQGLIQVTLAQLYAKGGRTFLRNDLHLYSVLAYLALVRLKELTFPVFRRFIRSVDSRKLERFVAFLFNAEHLQLKPTWGLLRKEWYKILDNKYIEENVINELSQHLAAAESLRQELEHIIVTGQRAKKSDKKPTQIEPFHLTENMSFLRPRTPETFFTPLFTKATPVPKTLYAQSKVAADIEKKKVQNRERLGRIHDKAKRTLFSVAKKHISEATVKRMEKIREEQALKYKVIRHEHHANPFRDHPPTQPVKLTAATILREDAILRKKKEEESAMIQEIEAGLKDASEYYAWKEKMKQEDEQKKRVELEKKRLAIQLYHESAIASKLDSLQANKEKADEAKKETEEWKAYLQEAKQDLATSNLEKHHLGQQSHEKARQAKLKKRQEKRRLAADLQRETDALAAARAEQMRAEMERKADLIRQIKAIEGVPQQNPLVTNAIKLRADITATAGSGLLTEMSIMELNERLALVKKLDEEEKAAKRKLIRDQKQIKQRILAHKKRTIEIQNYGAASATAAGSAAAAAAVARNTDTLALSSQTATGHAGRKGDANQPEAATHRVMMTHDDAELKELQRKVDERRAKRIQTMETRKRGEEAHLKLIHVEMEKRSKEKRAREARKMKLAQARLSKDNNASNNNASEQDHDHEHMDDHDDLDDDEDDNHSVNDDTDQHGHHDHDHDHDFDKHHHDDLSSQLPSSSSQQPQQQQRRTRRASLLSPDATFVDDGKVPHTPDAEAAAEQKYEPGPEVEFVPPAEAMLLLGGSAVGGGEGTPAGGSALPMHPGNNHGSGGTTDVSATGSTTTATATISASNTAAVAAAAGTTTSGPFPPRRPSSAGASLGKAAAKLVAKRKESVSKSKMSSTTPHHERAPSKAHIDVPESQQQHHNVAGTVAADPTDSHTTEKTDDKEHILYGKSQPSIVHRALAQADPAPSPDPAAKEK